jgi:hypothetical protein
MSPTFRWRRILRAAAGTALLICTGSLRATPSSTIRPAPWTPAELTPRDRDAILKPLAGNPARREAATEAPPAVEELKPEPPPLWVYRKGQWKLVVGNGGVSNSILHLELLKQVDEPAACLMMGMGLILIVMGPRQRKKRALARRRASRLPQRA